MLLFILIIVLLTALFVKDAMPKKKVSQNIAIEAFKRSEDVISVRLFVYYIQLTTANVKYKINDYITGYCQVDDIVYAVVNSKLFAFTTSGQFDMGYDSVDTIVKMAAAPGNAENMVIVKIDGTLQKFRLDHSYEPVDALPSLPLDHQYSCIDCTHGKLTIPLCTPGSFLCYGTVGLRNTIIEFYTSYSSTMDTSKTYVSPRITYPCFLERKHENVDSTSSANATLILRDEVLSIIQTSGTTAKVVMKTNHLSYNIHIHNKEIHLSLAEGSVLRTESCGRPTALRR